MSEDNELGSEKIKEQDVVVKKKKSGLKLSVLSLLISLVSVGTSVYLVTKPNHNNQDKSLAKISHIQSQLDNLKLTQSKQQNSIDRVNNEIDGQINSAKTIQSQLNILSNQLDSPTKDIYKQVSLVNLQMGIDYLMMAKDVAIFNGDQARASDLVDTAFYKIEASKVVSVSASDRQNIKNALKNYSATKNLIKEFALIQKQFSQLTYITPENLKNSNNDKLIKNKYLSFLNSIIEIQDISKGQNLVATNATKKLISDNLYNSLINLQSSIYSNSESSIEQTKNIILGLLKKYFIQNKIALNLEKDISHIKAQSTKNIDNSFDLIINRLIAQQNQLLTDKVKLTRIIKPQKDTLNKPTKQTTSQNNKKEDS